MPCAALQRCFASSSSSSATNHSNSANGSPGHRDSSSLSAHHYGTGNPLARTHRLHSGGCHGQLEMERPPAAVLAPSRDLVLDIASDVASVIAPLEQQHLAYEIVPGALVQQVWGRGKAFRGFPREGPRPPTAVLIHGLMGSRRNLQGLARDIVQAFPSWQVLLIDLRCHGDSLGYAPRDPHHSIHSAADDVLSLLRALGLFPQVLIGHSFGGKVALAMAEQFGRVGRTLPHPVQVWSLDAPPGEVELAPPPPSANGGASSANGAFSSNSKRASNSSGASSRNSGGPLGSPLGAADHPSALIRALEALPGPPATRNDAVAHCLAHGFSREVAAWVASSLRPASPSSSSPAAAAAAALGAGPASFEMAGFGSLGSSIGSASSSSGGASRSGGSGPLQWTFDLSAMQQLYDSYASTTMWHLLAQPQEGLRIDFLQAGRSGFAWSREDEALIRLYGHGLHVLPDASHWLHTSDPGGVLRALAPSFAPEARSFAWAPTGRTCSPL